MSDNLPDLGLIARQQQQLLSEFRIMRDDFAVLSAIVMRMDGTLSGLVNEIRAIHSQHGRLVNRVKALEDARDIP